MQKVSHNVYNQRILIVNNKLSILLVRNLTKLFHHVSLRISQGNRRRCYSSKCILLHFAYNYIVGVAYHCWHDVVQVLHMITYIYGLKEGLVICQNISFISSSQKVFSVYSPVVLLRCYGHSVSWMHHQIEHNRQIFWRSCNHAVNYHHIRPTGSPHLLVELCLCCRMSTV